MKNYFAVNPLIRSTVKGIKDIIDEPVIIQINDVNEKSTKEFSEKMSEAHQTSQPVIPIIVNSFGGTCYSVLSMISEIQNATKPVATIVTEKAMSAGMILLSMGTPGFRFASSHSTMLMHEVQSWAVGKITDMKEDTKHADYLNKKLFKMVANHCGHKDDYFVDIMHEKGHADWYLNAIEAKKHKLIDHIGIPENLVRIEATYEFRFGNKVLGTT